MSFIDRQSKYPGRVLITPEDGSAPFYATMLRADEPTVAGTPINAASLNELINRRGDVMLAQLEFNNRESYHAMTKYRTINEQVYAVNFGCGQVGGKGIVCFEVRQGSETNDPRLGRLEIGELGLAYVAPDGKRHYVYETGISPATVE